MNEVENKRENRPHEFKKDEEIHDQLHFPIEASIE